MQFCLKYWKQRNEINQEKNKQRERIIKQFRNERVSALMSDYLYLFIYLFIKSVCTKQSDFRRKQFNESLKKIDLQCKENKTKIGEV